MRLRLKSMEALVLGLMLTLPGASRAQALDADALLEQANKAIENGDYATAEGIYQEVAAGTAPDIAWFGTSGLVALYRQTGDSAAAHAVTAAVAAQRPDMAGLMAIWDGDTAWLAGDTAAALTYYQTALQPGFDRTVDGTRTGAVALQQIARLQASGGNPAAAAATRRQLLQSYPGDVWPEFEMAQALVLDAMAAGQLPLKPLTALGHDGDCTETLPCVVGATQLGTAGRRLAEIGGLRFVLSSQDEALLSTAGQPGGDTELVGEESLACTQTQATLGFQYPMANASSGYVFMQSIGNGAFHPGLDINGPGGCNADEGMYFRSVTTGCVTDASPANWGSATVRHSYNYVTSTSQYGHASTIYYSANSAIAKGAILGLVGRVGTTCAHLHHEMREADHPNAANADYYSNLTLANVGDWYHNPFPFQEAHRSYVNVRFADEDQFTTTGTWNAVAGVGNRDDMKWGATTSSATRYARYYFFPASSGTHDLWIFVPWNYGTSTSARYRMVRSNGQVMISTVSVNQGVLYDAWVRIGQASLTAGVEYYVEVSANTGETNRQVALDEIMIHRF